jgi:thiol-disulfide isomerase/thioredoxin
MKDRTMIRRENRSNGYRVAGVGMASLFSFIILSSSLALGSENEAPSANSGPDLVALKFHADWCPPCIKLGNSIGKIYGDYQEKPILFITFDVTNETTKQKANYLSSMMGFDKVWEEHSARLGFVLLVDARSKNIVDTLTADQSTEELKKSIDRALSRSKTGKVIPE